jgi:hypothetical protein
MAAPSRETLQRIASETGHQPATLEKVLRLLDLLQEIAGDSLLGDRLRSKAVPRSMSSISISTVSPSISI